MNRGAWTGPPLWNQSTTNGGQNWALIRQSLGSSGFVSRYWSHDLTHGPHGSRPYPYHRRWRPACRAPAHHRGSAPDRSPRRHQSTDLRGSHRSIQFVIARVESASDPYALHAAPRAPPLKAPMPSGHKPGACPYSIAFYALDLIRRAFQNTRKKVPGRAADRPLLHSG